MWQKIKTLIGPEEDGRDRLVAMDFGRGATNAFLDTFHQSEVSGRFFHLGQSAYRNAKEPGLSGKYQAEEGLRLRAKTLTALAPHPRGSYREGWGNSGRVRRRGARVSRLLRGDLYRQAHPRRPAKTPIRTSTAGRRQPGRSGRTMRSSLPTPSSPRGSPRRAARQSTGS